MGVRVSGFRPKPASWDRSKVLDGLGGWRISDVTIGYVTTEAQVGKTLSVAVGLTNLSDNDLILKFPTNQRIALTVNDSGGKQVYSSLPGTGGAAVETVKATMGIYWTEKIVLDPKIFSPGNYMISGKVMSDLVFSSTVELIVA
jgi:hypothetical protein